MKTLLTLATTLLVSTTTPAWDGYDYNTHAYIEIGSGNLVRSGNDIEIYDYGTGEYKYVEVQGFDYFGDLEVYDYNTGEYRTFDMD